MFVLLVMSIAAPHARASITCTGQAEIIQIQMQFIIRVPRDAPPGTVLTPWASSGADTSYFSCVRGDAEGASGTGFKPASLTKSGMTIPGPDGVNLTVWNTSLKGVGIAIEVRTYENKCGWTDTWTDLGAPPSEWYPAPWIGVPCNGGDDIRNGGEVKAAYVKTGPIDASSITPGPIMVGVAARAASMTKQSTTAPYVADLSIAKSIAISASAIYASSCTTPDVYVEMHTHWLSEFKGIGSATRPVSFDVAVNDCPAGLKRIQYQFMPVTAVVDPVNGVLALSGDSRAAGIGLQLKDGRGKPLRYNTTYTLADYNPAAPGSYRIPLSAAYYQTAKTMKPGSADTSLMFTMTYQ
ncbi:fimbrial protein [Burkholderia perseverans]|uniref:fimbrial protein n=1 Tax=Burkholderia perseverans TaxID=2615214 RepID=UPI001FEEFB36|nr:fimbrial protein [Burkholderia perseverans]